MGAIEALQQKIKELEEENKKLDKEKLKIRNRLHIEINKVAVISGLYRLYPENIAEIINASHFGFEWWGDTKAYRRSLKDWMSRILGKKESDQSVRTILEVINDDYEGSKSLFAEKQRITPAELKQWLNNDFIVVDSNLYYQRREIKK